MNCKEAYAHICDNLDADLNSPKCIEIRKHLESCSDCSAVLDSVKKTVYLYRTSPNPDLPDAIHQRLIKTLDLAWDSNAKPGETV
jgi:predicted anti-sigma-YlaC factor YlaD